MEKAIRTKKPDIACYVFIARTKATRQEIFALDGHALITEKGNIAVQTDVSKIGI
jgi:hypothetical protein